MTLTRRHFVITAVALAGGGLALRLATGGRDGHGLPAPEGSLVPSAWLQVRPDGEILLQVDKAELGQGVATGFVTLVAEELCVAPDMIRYALAPVHPQFQDPMQITAGSTSMLRRFRPLRETAATAREMLLAAAAERWGIARSDVRPDGQGAVVGPRGARLRYAELAEEASRLPMPRDVPLRPRAEYRVIGTRVPRPDLPDKVRGRAVYGLDVRLPGMLTAVIRRPPRLRASFRSFDDRAARAQPGVVDVLPLHSGIAVLAETFWHARRGAEALEVEWEPGPLAGLDDAAVRAHQVRALEQGRRHRHRDDGDVEPVLDRDQGHAAEYAVPYLAHATMEPMNATVWFREGGCEAWVPSQGPDLARQAICDLSGLPRERVQVHSTYAGGGFGRRSTMEFVVEAAEVARRTDRPVKLVWTREDDMRHGLYRESSLHRLRAALRPDGSPEAWEHRLSAAPMFGLLVPVSMSLFAPEWVPEGLVRGTGRAVAGGLNRFVGSFGAPEGSATLPYAIPNLRVEVVDCDPGVPNGIWRSVGHSYNGFVVESFIDELAHLANADPATYRRRLLAGHPRHLGVLDALVEFSGWSSRGSARPLGLALHEAFGSVVGQVAEVAVQDGAVRVKRVHCVVDCGLAINPDVVRQQLEGGILFGLTAALHGEINIDDGGVRQGNFDTYRLMRLAESPEIEVRILPGADEPQGIGETGVPPIAAAVGNAVFAATGRRLRSLPFRLGA